MSVRPPAHARRYRPALKVALIYGAFGMVWTMLGHAVSGAGAGFGALFTDYGDLVFILLSAVLIYVLVDTHSHASSRMRAQLRAREDELRLTFENAPSAIATLDLDGYFLSANHRACEMLGYPEAELCRLSFRDVTHPEDVEASEHVLAQCACGELSTYTFEKRYKHKDGHTVHGMVHNGIVYGSDGYPAMLVAQIEDLTDQRKTEQDAIENRERLAHVDRVSLLGEMAAGIAHEINQPLTAIANYADAARRRVGADNADPAKLLSSLEKVSRQAQRAGEVIRRLRALVRKRESQREHADINELTRDSVKLADVDARIHDINIDVELTSETTTVYVDSVQIQQVILNLLRNAVDATETEPSANRTIELKTDIVDGELVEVSVTDSGEGVSDEAAERVFSPFFTTKQSGMGMGLSISRSIINSHGGHLWFTRNPARGTTFQFTLPLHRETAHE